MARLLEHSFYNEPKIFLSTPPVDVLVSLGKAFICCIFVHIKALKTFEENYTFPYAPSLVRSKKSFLSLSENTPTFLTV